MSMTISEKILASKCGKAELSAGDIIIADIDIAMVHDLTGPLTIEAFNKMNKEHVWDSEKIVIPMDHQSPADSIESAENHKIMRKFKEEEGIENFYDINNGVCHQVLPENGHILPGNLVVGTDSHTCTHGALGAFATGIGSTDMAMVFATGKLWFKVPETIQFNITGELNKNIMSKDVILNIIGQVGADGAAYKACEFTGETVADMSVDSRMTMSNMAIEMGGKTGLIEVDEKTEDYLKNRTNEEYKIYNTDRDSESLEIINIDVDDLEPQIACPHNVDNVKNISDLDEDIDQVFLGSCTNGRLEDLKIAAEILKGKEISSKVRMLVIPASKLVYLEALKSGYIETFIKANATVCNPCCGPCLGGHIGIIGADEVSISTSNRNFKGRQGSVDGEVYLSSPAVAAASAITGKITNPNEIV